MTAKEFLSRYRWLNEKIDSEIEQAQRMRELASAVSSSCGGGSGGTSDKVGNAVAKLVDLESEINADIDKLVDLRREIETAIASVEDEKLQTLLRLRYISCLTWEQIAEKTGYCRRNVLLLHGKAIQKFSLFFTINL